MPLYSRVEELRHAAVLLTYTLGRMHVREKDLIAPTTGGVGLGFGTIVNSPGLYCIVKRQSRRDITAAWLDSAEIEGRPAYHLGKCHCRTKRSRRAEPLSTLSRPSTKGREVTTSRRQTVPKGFNSFG